MTNPFIDIINQVLPEPQAGLLNGILFGIRANLAKSFYEALITTGTIHIIALSGQNISILTRVLSGVTLVFGRKISLLLTIGGVVGFVLFVGIEPTIVRAAIMGSMTLLAVFFGRQSWAVLSLFLAAGLMLLVNPAWISEISFQLSFLATLGIVLCIKTPTAKDKPFQQEIIDDLRLSLKTTLVTQLFTLPIIWVYFHRFSLVAPLSNILIGWTILPIMVLGFITSLAGWFYIPLGQIVGWLVWVPLTFIVKVVEYTAQAPGASITL